MQADLIKQLQELASKIATLNTNTDVATLKNKAKVLYEKLTVLDFVTANISTLKNDIKKQVAPVQEETIETTQVRVEKPTVVTSPKPVQETPAKPELDSLLSEEDVTTIFDKEQWVVDKKETTTQQPEKTIATQAGIPKVEAFQEAKKPLNHSLIPQTITVGLNDRIAFVKHLFNHSQTDFNRVLSQLNTIDTEQAAYDFIDKMVKPEYNWEGEEEYEARFLDLIARRFS